MEIKNVVIHAAKPPNALNIVMDRRHHGKNRMLTTVDRFMNMQCIECKNV